MPSWLLGLDGLGQHGRRRRIPCPSPFLYPFLGAFYPFRKYFPAIDELENYYTPSNMAKAVLERWRKLRQKSGHAQVMVDNEHSLDFRERTGEQRKGTWSGDRL